MHSHGVIELLSLTAGTQIRSWYQTEELLHYFCFGIGRKRDQPAISTSQLQKADCCSSSPAAVLLTCEVELQIWRCLFLTSKLEVFLVLGCTKQLSHPTYVLSLGDSSNRISDERVKKGTLEPASILHHETLLSAHQPPNLLVPASVSTQSCDTYPIDI
jgi:hypothetical protein